MILFALIIVTVPEIKTNDVMANVEPPRLFTTKAQCMDVLTHSTLVLDKGDGVGRACVAVHE